jgi:hypothetical protein
MRTMVRIMADIRAAQAELARLDDGPPGTPEAEEFARAATRLSDLQEEWRAANARFAAPESMAGGRGAPPR